MFSHQILQHHDIPLDRYSEDRACPNTYGMNLRVLCKRCSLFIANGRIYSDKYIGHTTCKDASVVDYLILAPELFMFISEFEICDFNPMFSDVHNKIHFPLLCDEKETITPGYVPASTLRIHNVAVWLLFGQVPFLRKNYVATTYFRYVICKAL